MITLGGYQSPRLVVKPRAKALKAKGIEEDSFLFPLQSILVGKTEKAAPVGAIPGEIGKSQRLPMLPELLSQLKKAMAKGTERAQKPAGSVYKSQLNPGDPLETRNVVPHTKSQFSRSGSSYVAASRPQSAATTKRPQSAAYSARSLHPTFTQASFQRSRDSTSPQSNHRSSTDFALQSSLLIWDVSHKVMRFERGNERRLVTVEGETKTMSLEEPVKEKVPVPQKVDKYNGDYRGGKRDGHGFAEFDNGDTYDGDWVNDERQGRGVYTYKALGAVYTGDIRHNLKHGRGQLTFRNGDVLYGEFVNNCLIDSHVTIDYHPTGHYDGLMKEGRKHGLGTMEYAEHFHYEGDWVEDRRSGLGYIKFPGGFFEGVFIRDNVDGRGVLVFEGVFPVSRHSTPSPTPTAKPRRRKVMIGQQPRPSQKPAAQVAAVLIPHYTVAKNRIFGEDTDFFHFSGYRMRDSDSIWKTLTAKELAKKLDREDEEFIDGKFYRGALNGAAMVRYGKYAVYYGMFKDSKKHGYGQMTYTDPEHILKWLPESEGEYEGKWENDLRHGKGRMTFSNGLRYEGNFRCDHRHNVIGTLYFNDGNVYTGNWVDNIMQGKGQYRTLEGRVYEGFFVKGLFGSDGRLLYPTGEYYEGQVSRMSPHGSGRIKYTDGSSYEGQFDMGVRSGSGTMRYANGDIYEGDWEEGLREGYGKMSYFGRGERYEGFWGADMRNGKGTLIGKHGVFVGYWQGDVKEGSGEADHRVIV
jgi:hypothetical protein